MKTRTYTLAGIAFLFFILAVSLFTVEPPDQSKLLARTLYFNLKNFHYTDYKVDDDFSDKSFQEYLKFLDPNKSFFLKPDIEEFSKYRTKIDDEFKNGSLHLMRLTTARLEKRILQVQDLISGLLSEPFNFDIEESIELEGDKRDYCLNLEDLKECWRKILKYRTLIRYAGLIQADSSNNGKASLQEKAQQEVLKSILSGFNLMIQTNKKDALSSYLNSLLRIFDPHTAYMQPIAKDNFDIEMTGSFQGIGALLREEDGYVKIVRIIPGGPSWKQKQLEPNDIILKVAQGDKEPVDIIGMRTIDAVKLIRGKKGTEVRLTVKKTDGRILVISLIRDVVIVEETFAKSAVFLEKSSRKKFGYISLPSFYHDFEDKQGRTSAEDIKKEIAGLTRNNIEGLVLDLRGNGGGSLLDAIQISGYFIAEGPILQTKNRLTGIKVHKDPDPKVLYNDPLVVLIDNLSASAAEILAAALQDYKRAIIIGSPHTFGKGTVQVMINLDQQSSAKEPMGALKLTVQKFYRINGESNQYSGVIPDIVLPGQYDYLEIGEKYLNFSLKNDTIPPTDYEKWPQTRLDIPNLRQRSQARLKQNPYFTKLFEYIEATRSRRDQTERSLKLVTLLQEQKSMRDKVEDLEASQPENKNISVLSPVDLNQLYLSSPQLLKVAQERQEQWFSDLKKDYIINEALSVLLDLIRD